MKVNFKKLHPKAVLPKYAKQGDAGMDLTVTEVELLVNDVWVNVPDGNIDKFAEDLDIEDKIEDLVRYKLGVSVEIPKGHVGLIFPRSSVWKVDASLTNCVGVIDSGYRGEIMAVFRAGGEDFPYQIGDRCCQMIIMPYPNIKPQWFDDLSQTQRGTGGFGSTGK